MPPVKRISFVEGPPLDCGQLTVAIGPNTGGKSRFLRELVQSLTGVEAPRLAVAGLDLDREIVDAQAEQLIGAPASLDESGNLVFDVMTPDLGSANQVRPQPGYIQTIRSEPRLLGQLLQQIGAHLVAHLTTDRRLFLVNKHVNRNDLRGAQSPLHAAYLASGQVIDRINSLVEQAFGERLVLDKSDFAVAEFRLSPAGTRPDGSDHEQMAALPRLDEQGDGIRAFCGLIVATALVSRPIVLIDEPEAFLHPPQAFVAGRSLGILSQAEHQLFVATHSAEVLRGLLSENRAVNIMRFSRGGGWTWIFTPFNKSR